MIGNTRTKPMEILLVEDGLTDARVTIHALRRSQIHHRLTLVRTVAEALMFLRCESVFRLAPHPDLLLLDVMLPEYYKVRGWSAEGKVTDETIQRLAI